VAHAIADEVSSAILPLTAGLALVTDKAAVELRGSTSKGIKGESGNMIHNIK